MWCFDCFFKPLLFTPNEKQPLISPVVECPICFEQVKLVSLPKCNHRFCKECIRHWMMMKKGKTFCCPLCRQKFKKLETNYFLSRNRFA